MHTQRKIADLPVLTCRVTVNGVQFTSPCTVTWAFLDPSWMTSATLTAACALQSYQHWQRVQYGKALLPHLVIMCSDGAIQTWSMLQGPLLQGCRHDWVEIS